ncbi:hypothetical protein ABKV19_013827 [Rosa sericea]
MPIGTMVSAGRAEQRDPQRQIKILLEEAHDWKLPTPCKPIPQPPRQSFVDYKHVVDVDYYVPVSSDRAAKLKKAAQSKSNQQNTLEYHEIVEVL